MDPGQFKKPQINQYIDPHKRGGHCSASKGEKFNIYSQLALQVKNSRNFSRQENSVRLSITRRVKVFATSVLFLLRKLDLVSKKIQCNWWTKKLAELVTPQLIRVHWRSRCYGDLRILKLQAIISHEGVEEALRKRAVVAALHRNKQGLFFQGLDIDDLVPALPRNLLVVAPRRSYRAQ